MPEEIAVSRQLLRRLANRCAYTPTRLGSTLLADADAWRWAIDRATPAERVTLLLALRSELLVASAGGRARVARPYVHGVEVDELPFVVGDPEAVPLVTAALALLPDNVKWPLQRETAFLAVGFTSRAWTSAARFVDMTRQPKTRVIALGPSADVHTILHELGHVWNAGSPRADSSAVSAAGEAGIALCAARDGWYERLAAWEQAEEDLAEALALTWLLGCAEGKPS